MYPNRSNLTSCHNVISFVTLVFFGYGGNVLALTPAEIQAFLDAHNTHRAAHGAPPVSWSNTIADSAQNFIDTCPTAHSGTGFGENLAWANPTGSITGSVNGWYNEVNLYDFNNPGFSFQTGHFTQVVWKNTTEIGCGVKTDCPTPQSWPFAYHLVCQYSPAGNVTGQFPQNVMPLVPTAVNMTVGLGATNGGGWIDQLEGTPPHAHKSWQRVTWAAYDTAVGESRPVECDLDGDGTHELVIGLGSYPANGGWIEIKDDAAAGHAHLAWQRVDWGAYNSADGQTWPACGDIDGDGRDEILVGLGNAGKGWVKGFDDANTNYAALPGTPVANGWLRLSWSIYNNNAGAIHPAIGNLDADNREEIVLGVGTGGLGWVEVLDDSAGNYAHLNWVQLNFAAYNNSNGETWPAVCDLDNSGQGEIAIGLGNYPANGGWVQVRDAATGYAPLACINASGWIRVPWVIYNNANGASYPACLNLDGDNADELVLGLGMGA
nr:hypothetical protein [Gammaproteobacteria bacterium]